MFGSRRRKFENLYRRQCDRIYRLAVKLSGFDYQDARDVTQEVFIRAFESFDKYRDSGAEYAWLRTICINLVREKYRRFRFFKDRIEQEIQYAHEIKAGFTDPMGEMAGIEMANRVMETMNTLPVEFREVLVMRHLEGLSTAETAEALNIPEGTVRSRLKRARTMLVDRCVKKENLS